MCKAGVIFLGEYIMNIFKAFKSLTKFELCLWLFSVAVISISYCFSGDNVWSLITSLIGVTSLIFLARGFVIGQVLMIIFSINYALISYGFSYYGELLTYAGMTLPMAVVSLISWIRHPYKKTAEVEVDSKLDFKKAVFLAVSAVVVTVIFYFILKALGTANLLPSTFSVLTSYIAATLTAFRNPYFALGYAINDLVLIVLWILATMADLSYLPMTVCFIVFFINDMYGFICWKKMEKRQKNL